MILSPLNWQIVSSNLPYWVSHQLAQILGYIDLMMNECGGGNLISPPKHNSNAAAAAHPSGSRSPPVLNLVAIGTDK